MSYQLSRRRVAPELEMYAFDRRKCRKAAFNSEGKDVRLITFGVKWRMVGEKREEISHDFMGRIQEVFDDVYEKITGGKRTSLDCHLLPTIKTPAIKKTRPRVIHVEDVEGGEEQDQGETRLGQSPTITTVTFEDHTSANATDPVDEPMETSGTTVRQSTQAKARTGTSASAAQVSAKDKRSLEDFVDTSLSVVRRSARSRTAKARATTVEEKENLPVSDKRSLEDFMDTSLSVVRRSARSRTATTKARATTVKEKENLSVSDKRSLEDFADTSLSVVRRSARARTAKARATTVEREGTAPVTTSRRATRARTTTQKTEVEKEGEEAMKGEKEKEEAINGEREREGDSVDVPSQAADPQAVFVSSQSEGEDVTDRVPEGEVGESVREGEKMKEEPIKDISSQGSQSERGSGQSRTSVAKVGITRTNPHVSSTGSRRTTRSRSKAVSATPLAQDSDPPTPSHHSQREDISDTFEVNGEPHARPVPSREDHKQRESNSVKSPLRHSLRTLDRVVVERLTPTLASPSLAVDVDDEVSATVVDETLPQIPESPTESNEEPSLSRQTRLVSEPKRVSSRQNTNNYPVTSESEDESYTRPPPPKKSLRLKKKGGRPRKGKGRKKAGTRVSSTDSKLLEEHSTLESHPEGESVAAPVDNDSEEPVRVQALEETASEPMETDEREGHSGMRDTEAEELVATEVHAYKMEVNKDKLLPTISAESMYESCVSEVEDSPRCTRQTAKRSRVLTPVHPPVLTTQRPTATATTVTNPPRVAPPPTHPSTPKTRTTVTKTPITVTVTKTPKVHVRKTPLGGTSTKERPVLSPLRVPHLTGTPKALHRLQEKGGARGRSPVGGGGVRGSPVGVRVISITELRASHSRILTPTTATNSHSQQRTKTPSKTPKVGAKRLRSVSLEKLPADLSHLRKRPTVALTSSSEEGMEEEEFQSLMATSFSDETETDGTQDEGGSSSAERTESDPEPAPDCQGTGTTTKSKSCSKTAAFWQLLQKKGEGVASKLAFANVNPTLTSFLPRNSPQKQETFESRQVKLAEKVQRKKDEEEKRWREMEQKKQQDLEEKIRKREERLRRVAEKQAALQREEEEKKKRAQGLRSRDNELKKQRITQKKVKEMEEKNKKAKEHKEAVENRRKQEEEQRLKRLQQIEEERRMAEELLRMRLQQEEEDKRLKRQERQKQELERQAEWERLELEQRNKREEEAERLRAEETRRTQQEGEGVRPPPSHQKEHEKKRFEQLLISQQKSTGANRFVQQWKQMKVTPGKNAAIASGSSLKGTVTKSKPSSQISPVINGGARGPSPMDNHTTTSGTVVKAKPDLVLSQDTMASQSAMNSTFTKDDSIVTPAKPNHPHNSKYTTAASYQMTPAEKQDPLSVYSNYDITELSDDDSTDDEDQPRKPVPVWAHPHILNKWMLLQEERLNNQVIKVSQIFPPEQLLKVPDLGRIFKVKRRRFYHRSSSAQWDSPLLKKTRKE